MPNEELGTIVMTSDPAAKLLLSIDCDCSVVGIDDPGAWSELLFVPWGFGLGSGLAPFPGDVDRESCCLEPFDWRGCDGPAV